MEDVVITMANALGVAYRKEHHEYVLDLPKTFGEGEVCAYKFSEGVGVVRTSYQLQKDFHFDLEKGKVHPLKIIFNTGAQFKHKLEKENSFKDVSQLHTLIVASTPTNNHRFMIPSNTKSKIFTIEINRKEFESRIADFEDEMPEELNELFRDIKGVVPFTYMAPYSYAIGEMIDEFVQCRYTGFMRRTYQEGKVLEILTAYLEQYLDDKSDQKQRTVLRSKHIEYIRNAADYITKNLDAPIPLKKLANKVGINPNILQNGFRIIYGMSVGEYERNIRLKEAGRLVGETELNFSEITYALGLSSKSYFSKLFREHFGMTPSQYRERNKTGRIGS